MFGASESRLFCPNATNSWLGQQQCDSDNIQLPSSKMRLFRGCALYQYIKLAIILVNSPSAMKKLTISIAKLLKLEVVQRLSELYFATASLVIDHPTSTSVIRLWSPLPTWYIYPPPPPHIPLCLLFFTQVGLKQVKQHKLTFDEE